MRLDSLSVTSLTQVPGKRDTSRDSVSSQQMGASVWLRRELPTAVTHCLFLVALVIIRGADRMKLNWWNSSTIQTEPWQGRMPVSDRSWRWFS